jgi:hypothetical protein
MDQWRLAGSVCFSLCFIFGLLTWSPCKALKRPNLPDGKKNISWSKKWRKVMFNRHKNRSLMGMKSEKRGKSKHIKT